MSTDDLSKYKVCLPGDVVLNRFNAYRGSLGVAGQLGVVSPDYMVVRPRAGAHSAYLEYLLRSNYLQHEMTRSMGGIGGNDPNSSGFSRIDVHHLSRVPVPARSLNEQRAIADFLDRETAKIDALVDKQNEMIDLLQERRLSTINSILCSAPGVRGTPLRNVVDIQSGITLGKTYDVGVAVQEYPYLRVANVQTGFVDTEDLTTIELPPSLARQAMLRDGDVLITEGGDRAALARGSLWQGQVEPCLHQNHLYVLRPKLNRLLARYLVYVLEGSEARQYFERTRRQTTNLSATNSRLVRAFRFTLPTVPEQRTLVDHLDRVTTRIDALMDTAEQFVGLAKERRAALITAAVTGRIDVTGKGDRDGASADDSDLLAVG